MDPELVAEIEAALSSALACEHVNEDNIERGEN